MGNKERGMGTIMLKIPNKTVAVDPIFESEKRGSLYIPEQAVGRVKQGIVKYIGVGVETVEIGDYVFFSGYAGTVFRLEGEGTLLFLPEENIVATLKERAIDIAGLYFYGGSGEYFTATFEQAMQLITQAMSKYFVKIREPQDRAYEGKSTKTEEGRRFVIKNQDHITGEGCFCMTQGAKDYNNGICPKCGSLLHRAYLKTWTIGLWHCENFSCKWNTEGK